jgi:hypothetical protein
MSRIILDLNGTFEVLQPFSILRESLGKPRTGASCFIGWPIIFDKSDDVKRHSSRLELVIRSVQNRCNCLKPWG